MSNETSPPNAPPIHEDADPQIVDPRAHHETDAAGVARNFIQRWGLPKFYGTSHPYLEHIQAEFAFVIRRAWTEGLRTPRPALGPAMHPEEVSIKAAEWLEGHALGYEKSPADRELNGTIAKVLRKKARQIRNLDHLASK